MFGCEHGECTYIDHLHTATVLIKSSSPCRIDSYSGCLLDFSFQTIFCFLRSLMLLGSVVTFQIAKATLTNYFLLLRYEDSSLWNSCVKVTSVFRTWII